MSSRTSTIPFILLIFELWRGFNTFRTTFAIAFILVGFVALNREKKIGGCLLIIISFFIHTASIVYVLFLPFYYLFKKNKIKPWQWVIISGGFYFLARMLQKFFLGPGAGLIRQGIGGYISSSLGKSIFAFNVINLEHGLLFACILIYASKLKKSIGRKTPDEQKKFKLLILICYFDFLTIPIDFVLGIWRGYEYLYVPRLVMFGELIAIFKERFASSSRWIFTLLFTMAFVGWLVFRIYNMWEASRLMPYVFEPFIRFIQ
jgi:hypothetical protein